MNGYVTLSTLQKKKTAKSLNVQERTGIWAWKHYHKEDGTTTYIGN